jgi:hypothetical protein
VSDLRVTSYGYLLPLLQCPGLQSRSSHLNVYRGQTGNWGQGKWVGGGGGEPLSFSMVVHFWNSRL